MKLLKDRILKDGKVINDSILKVDNFINHQLDISLFNEIGKELKKRFNDKTINKILTVETSGIAIASIVSQYFDNVPVLFAKKHAGSNMDTNVFESTVHSFTKNTDYKIKVSKEYLTSKDKVLIIDDFLASGSAVIGLLDLVKQANAEAVGVGIVIEKYFQGGRKLIENQNVKLESLAVIEGFKNGEVIFKK
ncbi:xanthine phosphoribosyltransferase [Clostridium acetireducens DSM 10703]|uniref:Xanthine phosphoribosyltransferase n=1 Tax=Clostridium acetireducens DSM 10703 TaxID=1121290 RepID=A0A1E8EZ05_9CLOT|nr:xanthine phosphoribosyltransferase [Clostridium acetireducens]OFI06254.1 xanthine phosphoribosyltransferase [Clostridium acetireducens DSM 10703]